MTWCSDCSAVWGWQVNELNEVNVMSRCLNRCNENKTKKQTLSRTTWTSACCYHNSSSSKLFLQLWPRNVTSKRFDFDGSMNFLWFWAFASWKLANNSRGQIGQMINSYQFTSVACPLQMHHWRKVQRVHQTFGCHMRLCCAKDSTWRSESWPITNAAILYLCQGLFLFQTRVCCQASIRWLHYCNSLPILRKFVTLEIKGYVIWIDTIYSGSWITSNHGAFFLNPLRNDGSCSAGLSCTRWTFQKWQRQSMFGQVNSKNWNLRSGPWISKSSFRCAVAMIWRWDSVCQCWPHDQLKVDCTAVIWWTYWIILTYLLFVYCLILLKLTPKIWRRWTRRLASGCKHLPCGSKFPHHNSTRDAGKQFQFIKSYRIPRIPWHILAPCRCSECSGSSSLCSLVDRSKSAKRPVRHQGPVARHKPPWGQVMSFDDILPTKNIQKHSPFSVKTCKTCKIM